jgi:hypothetical protein
MFAVPEGPYTASPKSQLWSGPPQKQDELPAAKQRKVADTNAFWNIFFQAAPYRGQARGDGAFHLNLPFPLLVFVFLNVNRCGE